MVRTMPHRELRNNSSKTLEAGRCGETIHAAMRTPADVFVSNDSRQLTAARDAGLSVASRGRS